MSEQEITSNPPRIPTVPQTPLPQTVCGVLEHTGVPMSEPENITDIPPDFGWMSEMEYFIDSFTFDRGSKMTEPLIKIPVPAGKAFTYQKPSSNPIPWQAIPFLTSRWWNGAVTFRFVAIKSPRTTGKLLIRYSFLNNSQEYQGVDFGKADMLRRGVIREWDLGATSEFSFDVTGLNPMQARPTWLPITSARAIDPTDVNSKFKSFQSFNPATYLMGRIEVWAVQSLQPGSIFPSSIRILIFRSFKNSSFYIPTEPRGYCNHTLTQHNALKPLDDR